MNLANFFMMADLSYVFGWSCVSALWGAFFSWCVCMWLCYCDLTCMAATIIQCNSQNSCLNVFQDHCSNDCSMLFSLFCWNWCQTDILNWRHNLQGQWYIRPKLHVTWPLMKHIHSNMCFFQKPILLEGLPISLLPKALWHICLGVRRRP